MAFQSTRDPAQARLLLLTAVLFISYLCVAMPLPIVPVYVTEQLELSNVWLASASASPSSPPSLHGDTLAAFRIAAGPSSACNVGSSSM